MTDSLGSASGAIELDAAGALRALDSVKAGVAGLGSVQPGGGFTSWVQSNQQHITTLGQGITGIGVALLGAFGIGAKVTADFDAQMSAVASVSGATAGELSDLREEALRLGADTTFSASEAAQAMEIMAKAGAPLEDILNGATEAAINLSASTGADITLSAETAATAMNIFGVSAEEAADIIAQSSNASALDVNDWALALKAAGPVAQALGVDMDDLAAGMVILGDAGIKGEVGATALRNIMLGLADTTNEGVESLAELGIATYDAQGNFRGLEAITHDLTASWASMTDEQRLNLAQQIAGKDGAAAFLAIMEAQTEAVDNNSDAFTDATDRQKETGTAAEQAAKRMDNLRGSMEQLGGTIESALITAFTGISPALRAVVDGINGVLKLFLRIPTGVQTALAAFLGIAGVLGVVTGGFLLMLPRIASTIEAFRALRPALLAARASMLSFLGPILLIVAAAALLYAAYQTNFLGFADGVDALASKVASGFGKVVGVVADVVKTFKVFRKTTNPVTAALQAVANVLDSLGGGNIDWLDDIADGLRDAGELVEDFLDQLDSLRIAFNFFRSHGSNPLTASLQALGRIFPQLSGLTTPILQLFQQLQSRFQAFRDQGLNPVQAALSTVGAVFTAFSDTIDRVKAAVEGYTETWDNLKQAIGAFVQGDFASGFDALGDAAVAALQAIGNQFLILPTLILDAVQAIDWGAVGSALLAGATAAVSSIGSLAIGIWDWITDRASNIDWDGIGSSLRTGAERAVAYVQNLATAVWDWIKDQADQVDWDGIGSTLRLGALRAIIYVQNLAIAVWDWIGEQAGQVDWDGIGSMLLSGGLRAANYLTSITADVWGWIRDKAAAVDWDGIGSTLLLGALRAVAYLTSISIDVWGWIREQANRVDWDGIGSALLLGGLRAVAYLTSLATDIWGWIKTKAGEIEWGSIGETLKAGFRGALASAFELGEDAGEGAVDVFSSVLGWVTGQLEGKDWGSIGELIGRGIGLALVAAITGIGALVGLAGAFLAGIGNALIDVEWDTLADKAWRLFKAAFNAWTDLVQGLFEGFFSAIPTAIKDSFADAIDEARRSVNEIIKLINTAIDALNKLPGTDIPHVALILSDIANAMKPVADGAKNAAREALALGKALALQQPDAPALPPGGGTTAPVGPGNIPGGGGGGLEEMATGGRFFQIIDQLKQVSGAAKQVGVDVAGTSASVGAFRGVLGTIGVAGQSNFAALKAAYDGNVPPITTGFRTTPATWQAPVQTALQAITGAFNANLPGLSATTQTHFAAVKAAATTNTNAAQVAVTTSLKTMQTSGTVSAEGLKNSVSASVETMKSNVATASTGARLAMAAQNLLMVAAAKLSYTSMANQARDSANAMKAAMASGAAGAAAAVRSGLGVIPGIVASVGGSAASVARSVGANIGNAMAAGMRSALGAISAAASAMVAQADRALRAAASIASPSKLFIRLGQYTGEGYGMGILDMIPLVKRAARDLVQAPQASSFGPAFAYGGYASSPSASSHAMSQITYGNITYGDILIEQQPGEDGEALANRVITKLREGWHAAKGPA